MLKPHTSSRIGNPVHLNTHHKGSIKPRCTPYTKVGYTNIYSL